MRIVLDEPTIPLGTGVTGHLEIWSSPDQPITLEKGVSLMRGGVSWLIEAPSGEVLEVSDLRTGLSINAITEPIELTGEEKLYVPLCLFCFNSALIFTEQGSYKVSVHLVSDQKTSLTNEVTVVVLEATSEYPKWAKEVITPFLLVEAFYFPLAREFFDNIDLEENGPYEKFVNRFYVYNEGFNYVGGFFASPASASFSDENIREILREHILAGLEISAETKFGQNMWGFVAEKYNKQFYEYEKIEFENRDFGNWAVR